MTSPAQRERRRALLTQILQSDAEGREALESTSSLESAARRFSATRLVAHLESLADQMPAADMIDANATRRAGKIVADCLRSALEKARNNDLQSITDGEDAAFEAVILADGSRPTLLLRDGAPSLDHPMIGGWRDVIAPLKDEVARTATAVCRIEPDQGSAENFIGTGFLVNAGQGLVLTNQHVLQALLGGGAAQAERNGLSFRIRGGAFAEFCGEADSLESRRFKIVEAWPTPMEGLGFSQLDIAVLRVEPETGAGAHALPSALPLDMGAERADGALISFCLIGFPGPPAAVKGVYGGVDFAWVHHHLFGGRYGLKRIAPAKLRRAVGSVDGDTGRWVFCHDGTTLGGSSGSPVIAWMDGNRAFGIHFAGQTGESNYAHSLHAAREGLQRFAAPLFG